MVTAVVPLDPSAGVQLRFGCRQRAQFSAVRSTSWSEGALMVGSSPLCATSGSGVVSRSVGSVGGTINGREVEGDGR